MKRLINRLIDTFARRFGGPPLRLELTPGEELWAAGDLAECILTDPWRLPSGQVGIGPVYQEVRLVDRVVVERHDHTGEAAQFLIFARYAPSVFEAIVFRKVTPRRDPPVPAMQAWLGREPELTSPLESEMS